MTSKTKKSIEFNNTCNCIVDYGELEKAILWYAKSSVRSVKKIYIHEKYPAVTINKGKIHIHRLLMNYWLNTIIPSNFCVHHINENKLDDRKENLAVVFISTHQSNHNKGKILTEKQKKILIENNHKRKGIKKGIIKKGITYRKIFELYQKGYSINKISKQLNYDWEQVKIRLKEVYDNPELLKED